MPKLEQSKPPYVQIAESIQGQILRGQLAVGDAIPTLRAIADDWSVSQVTASKAVNLLQEQGFVKIGGPGLRTVVQNPKEVDRNGQDRARSVRRSGRIYTPGEYAQIRSAEIVPAPSEVAAALGLPGPNPMAIRRVRVTYGADHQPVSASTSWLDAQLAEQAPKLLETERIREGSWGYVEKQTGRKAARGRDQISTRLATDDDAELLGLSLPAAVKVSQTMLWTSEGVAIEYGVSVAGSGRQSTYDYTIEDLES